MEGLSLTMFASAGATYSGPTPRDGKTVLDVTGLNLIGWDAMEVTPLLHSGKPR